MRLTSSLFRYLLVALLIQASVWTYLWFNIQAGDVYQFQSGWLNADRSAFFVDRTHYWLRPVRSQFMRFDLQKRTWKWVTRRAAITEFPGCPPEQTLWELKSPANSGDPYRAELFDRDTHQTLASREIPRPLDVNENRYRPQLISNRYVVNANADRIDYLDLNNSTSQLESLSFESAAVGTPRLHASLQDHESSLVVQAPRSALPNSPTQVDLLRFNSHGKLDYVRGWQTARDGMTYVWRDLLITIPLDATHGEVRRLDSDQVVGRWQLSKNFNVNRFGGLLPAPDTVIFQYSTATGMDKWDVIRNEAIKIKSNFILAAGGLDDGSLRLYYDSLGTSVWDTEQGRALFRLPLNFHSLRLLNNQSLLYTSQAYGISFYFYELPTGRLINCYRPFGYVPWLCLALLLGFAYWSYLWMRASTKAGWSPWLDLLFILWLPCLVARLFGIQLGSPSGFNYLTEIALGTSTGGLAVAVVWATVSRDPFWRRCLPLAWFEFINLAILWLVPAHRSSEPLQLLLLQHFPLLLVASYYQFMRMLMLRLDGPTDHSSEPVRLQLQDFFVLTLCVAAALGVYQLAEAGKLPEIEPLSAPFRPSAASLGLVYCLSVSLASILMPNFRSSFSFQLVRAIAVVITCTLIVEAMLRWTLAIYLVKRVTAGDTIYTGLVAALSVFVACLPLRYRGVRYNTAKPPIG